MSFIAEEEKKLAADEKELARIDALIANLDEPRLKQERQRQKVAERRAAVLAAKAELEQIVAERNAAQDWLDQLAPALPHLEDVLLALATAENMLASGHLSAVDLGMDKYDVNAVWAKFSNLAHDQLAAKQAMVARLSARINELGGK